MLRWMIIFSIFSLFAWAEVFHPYAIKSGKIMYEKRKYSMHSELHIDSHDRVTGKRTTPSYVEEEVTFYWDNYGDVAYEVAYQVSKFGGKPLAEKVKKYERLWKGDHRYYYDVKKKKVSDDPYYTRKACLKAGKTEWLKVMYPKAAVVAEESIAGKMVKHYKESEMHDFYAWEGIILRDVSYSTKKKNGKYKRFEPDRERIAVKVEADSNVDASVFNPDWLKNR